MSISQEREMKRSRETSNESSVARTINVKGKKTQAGTVRQFHQTQLKSRNMGMKKIALHNTQKPMRSSVQEKFGMFGNLSN